MTPAADPTPAQDAELLRHLEEDDTEDLQGYSAVLVGQTMGLAAARIRADAETIRRLRQLEIDDANRHGSITWVKEHILSFMPELNASSLEYMVSAVIGRAERAEADAARQREEVAIKDASKVKWREIYGKAYDAMLIAEAKLMQAMRCIEAAKELRKLFGMLVLSNSLVCAARDKRVLAFDAAMAGLRKLGQL